MIKMSKNDVIAKNYNHIYSHELAHKNAGGQFAGAISIERNADGMRKKNFPMPSCADASSTTLNSRNLPR